VTVVTNKLEISIPQSAVWLLRLAVNPILSGTLQKDPMAFAAWYAAVGSVITWPEPVVRIQESERAKRLSLERMMKLLSQVNYTFSGRTSAGHARLVLEGYAVHEWVHRNAEEFTAVATSTQERLSLVLNPSEAAIEALSPFAARVGELGRTLKLSSLERDILSFAFLTTVSDELSGIFASAAAWAAPRCLRFVGPSCTTMNEAFDQPSGGWETHARLDRSTEKFPRKRACLVWRSSCNIASLPTSVAHIPARWPASQL
jgi:hypothetical protein